MMSKVNNYDLWSGFWSWKQLFFTEIKLCIPYLCEWLIVARIVLRESLLFVSLFLNPILTGSTQLLLTGLVTECMSDIKVCEPEQQSLYLHPTRHSNPVSYPTSHWLVLSPPKGQRVDGVQVGDDWRALHLHSPWQMSLHLSDRTLTYVAPNSVISHVVSHPGLKSQSEPFRCHMSLCQHIPWFITHRKWGLCSFCGVISRIMGFVCGVVTQSNTFHELEEKKSVGSLSSCWDWSEKHWSCW